MQTYVQYAADGTITGSVTSATAPVHPRQLTMPEFTDIWNKRVNLETLELEDIPQEE